MDTPETPANGNGHEPSLADGVDQPTGRGPGKDLRSDAVNERDVNSFSPLQQGRELTREQQGKRPLSPAQQANLFKPGQSGNPSGHTKQRLEKYIRQQTDNGREICDLFLRIMRGEPFRVSYYKTLPLTREQVAVAQGEKDPDVIKKARKQKHHIRVFRQYRPTVAEMAAAAQWLKDSGWGKAQQIITLEDEDGALGLQIMYRQWPVGVDPFANKDKVIDGKAKVLPLQSHNGHTNGNGNGNGHH